MTITVNGTGDPETAQRLNQAITAILKSSSNGWRISYSTLDNKTIFRVGPVIDPKAFADKIDFGKVTRVEGQTIDVEVAP